MEKRYDTVELRVDLCLPSWNEVISMHWGNRQALKRIWLDCVAVAENKANNPRIKGAVRLEIQCYYPPRKQGGGALPDWDNQCVKYLIDALRKRIIKNDNVRIVTGGYVGCPKQLAHGEEGWTQVKIHILGD